MKRITTIILCAVISIALITACSKPQQPLSAAELLDLGEKYLLELNYEQALVQFLKVIEVKPMNPRGYIGAAEAYVSLGRIDDAIDILRHGYDITGDENILSMLNELFAEDELESLPDMRAVAEAYLKILEENEHEIRSIVIKDITGDGIPELIFTQLDFESNYVDLGWMPEQYYLAIWSFDEEARLLFRLEEPFGLSEGGGSGYYVIAGNDGRLDVYRSWREEIYTHDIFLIGDSEPIITSSGNPYGSETPQGLLERAEWHFGSDFNSAPYNNTYENYTYYINGEEMSHSEHFESWDEIWDNEFGMIGNHLLLAYWLPENRFLADGGISGGYFESVAELESILFGLAEGVRQNHMAHGAYTDMLVGLSYSLSYGDFRITINNERAEFFHLIDMDGDGVDELLVLAQHQDTRHWMWNLFSYKNGRVRFIEEKDGYVHGNSEMYIVDDKYILLIWDVGRAQVIGTFVEYTGYDGSSIKKYSYNFSSYFLEVVNDEWIWEDYFLYSFNDQEISEEEYNEFVNTLEGSEISFEDVVRRIDYSNIDLFRSLRKL